MEYFERLVRGDPWINMQPIRLKVLTVSKIADTDKTWAIEVRSLSQL